MKPQSDPSWTYYGETIVELDVAGGLAIDLRATIPESQRQQVAAGALGEQFAILTAFNPHGRDHDADDNARRDARLRDELTRRGIPWVCADGRSPDATHREPGVAIRTDRGTAIAIARDYGQSAIYWYDGGTVWLVGALVDTPPERLPRRNTRV